MLPPPVTRTEYFTLNAEEEKGSGEPFAEFLESKDNPTSPTDWKSYARASHFAFNKQLTKIYEFVPTYYHPETIVTTFERMEEIDEELENIWDDWHEDINSDSKLALSSRVNKLLDIFASSRITNPSSMKFLIIDESSYFLDVLMVAFTHRYMPEYTPTAELDDIVDLGKVTIKEDVEATVRAFNESIGPAILLSPPHAVRDLDLSAATVVIFCGPLWNSGWEKEVIDTVATSSKQTKQVEVITVEAKNCSVEKWKLDSRSTTFNPDSRLGCMCNYSLGFSDRNGK